MVDLLDVCHIALVIQNAIPNYHSTEFQTVKGMRNRENIGYTCYLERGSRTQEMDTEYAQKILMGVARPI